MIRSVRVLLSIVLILCMTLPCAVADTPDHDFVFHQWGSYTVFDEEFLIEDTDAAIDFNHCVSTTSGSSGEFSIIWRLYKTDVDLDPERLKISGDYTYYLLEDGTAAILDIAKEHQTKTLTIPSAIDGVTVSQLGYSLNTGLGGRIVDGEYVPGKMISSIVETLVLPDSLRLISANVFTDSKIKLVNYPDHVKEIGTVEHFFNGQIGSLPKSLEKLGNMAFFYASFKNRSLKLNTGLIEIGQAAFMLSNLKSITIPGTVTQIGKHAFTLNKSLTTVTLSEGVPYVGEYMFACCEKLSKINIPASVTEIGQDAFMRCSKLNKLTFSKNAAIKTIDEGAFRHCTALSKVTLPEGLESIRSDAFFDCPKLVSVTIPATVHDIGDHAFSGCSSKLVITVTQDSYAHQWAEANGFKVKIQKSK